MSLRSGLYLILFSLGLVIVAVGLFVHNLTWTNPSTSAPTPGVRLVYRLIPLPGAAVADRMSATIEVLQKRIDPERLNVAEIKQISADEIEINVPTSAPADPAFASYDALRAADIALNALNLHRERISAVISLPAGPARRAALEQMAAGDPAALARLMSISDMADQLATARNSASSLTPDSPEMIQTEDTIDRVSQNLGDALSHIQDDNLEATDLASILDPNDAQSVQQLDAIRQRYSASRARLAAIDKVVQAYRAMTPYAPTIESVLQIQHSLTGAGLLEFHIVAYDQSDILYKAMLDRMNPGGAGPGPQNGDKYRWFMLANQKDAKDLARTARQWNGEFYVLCLTTPDASMTPSSDWGLARAYLSSDPNTGFHAVGFQFDANGAHLFGDLTTRWKPDNNGNEFQLATILDGKTITAPNINGPITGGSGILTGGGNGFTPKELDYLVTTLNAGALPVQLAFESRTSVASMSILAHIRLNPLIIAIGTLIALMGVLFWITLRKHPATR